MTEEELIGVRNAINERIEAWEFGRDGAPTDEQLVAALRALQPDASRPLVEAIRFAKDALARRVPAGQANIHPDMLGRLIEAAETLIKERAE